MVALLSSNNLTTRESGLQGRKHDMILHLISHCSHHIYTGKKLPDTGHSQTERAQASHREVEIRNPERSHGLHASAAVHGYSRRDQIARQSRVAKLGDKTP